MQGTWESMNAYTSRGISVKTFCTKEAPINNKFDLGIFFGTFESRGLISSKILADKSCNETIIVFFPEANQSSYRRKYDQMLFDQVKSCSRNAPILIENESIRNCEILLQKLLKAIPKHCWNAKANWFFDISGSPVPYFLGIAAAIRETYPRPKITMFNPTANYDNPKNNEYSFTFGFDRLIWIPGLWGHPDPTLPTTYIFLLGFDGERSYEVFYRCDPDKVKVLYGKPGYKRRYENMALRRNRLLMEESGVVTRDSKNLLAADASDPIDTWKKMDKVVKSEQGKSNVIFVPVGLKAHAIGSALCALTDGIPGMIYHVPSTYRIQDIKRGEYLWKYEIVL